MKYLSYLWHEQVQRYACNVVIKDWPQFANENALFYLEKIRIIFPPDECEILPCHRSCSTAVRSHMLKGCIHLNTSHRLARTSRDMCVFLQTFFPKPFRRAYVTEIALSASVLVNNARHQGLGKFVFEVEAGSTKRYWEKRLEEHTHLSARTGEPLSGMIVYAPLQHVKSDDCAARSVNREDFTFIGRESDPHLLQVKESIFISKLRPVLNNNITSVPLHLFTS